MRLRFHSIEYQFGGAASSLERYFRDLRDELLRQGQHYGLLHSTGQWRPPTDIHETPDAVRIKIELAGMSEETIEVTLYENALVVAGRRDDDADHDEGVCYHEAQVRYGPFRAEILLPAPVRHDEVEATYENGFLRIRLPKVVQSQPGSSHPRATGASGHTGGAQNSLNATPAATETPTTVMTAQNAETEAHAPARRID